MVTPRASICYQATRQPVLRRDMSSAPAPPHRARAGQETITRQSICDDLVALGAAQGDVIYIRCGLARIGVRSRDMRDLFLGGIQDAIGPGGTIIAPAFTNVSFRWRRPLPVFTLSTPPTTGAFSKMLLSQPGAVRSNHPTHSFVGLGKHAVDILGDHPHDGSSFEPIRKIVERDGLMALIGCVPDSPGFSTVHLAQYDLGLSKRHWARLLFAVEREDGSVFIPVESPGCSRNFGAFYKQYVERDNLATGHVGNAWSIAVRAADAYAQEYAVLANNPRYPICDLPDCFSCRMTRGYNKRAIPRALLHRLRRALLKSA